MAVATPPAAVDHLRFGTAASDEVIERTAEALRAKGYTVHIAADAAEAKRLTLAGIPDGAHVHEGASMTLDELGVTKEIEELGRYEAVRPKIRAMDRATQWHEIRQIGSAPEVIVGSAHAVTQSGELLFASNTGSQLSGYAFGAGKVIWVIGSQKIVPDIKAAWERIYDYAFPRESERMLERYGSESAVSKVLLVNGERVPGRITIILVKGVLGS